MNRALSILKCISIVFILGAYENTFAQNLAPNNSFESLLSCPTGQGQVGLAFPWSMPSNVGPASSDLFNSCNGVAYGVPTNDGGFQNAHSGQGYAGIFVFGAGNIREYCQTEMWATLTTGSTYLIEFYVSPGNAMGAAVDAIGAYLSAGPVSGTGNPGPLPFVPQVVNTPGNFLSDTLDWILVSGLYTASGGENFITIGNFLSDSLTDTLVYNPAGYDRAYYYIDDVSVTFVTQTPEYDSGNKVQVFPSPFSNELFVQCDKPGSMSLVLYDIHAKTVLNSQITQSMKLDTQKLNKGIYFFTLSDDLGIIKMGKIIKE